MAGETHPRFSCWVRLRGDRLLNLSTISIEAKVTHQKINHGKCAIQWWEIRSIVPPSPVSSSRTFLLPQKESLDPLSSHTSSPLNPWQPLVFLSLDSLPPPASICGMARHVAFCGWLLPQPLP